MGGSRSSLALCASLLIVASALANPVPGDELRAVDLDADGLPDLRVPGDVYASEVVLDGWPADRDADGALEWVAGEGPAAPGDPAAGSSPLTFDLVWDSGATLNTIWTVESGDADLDAAFDFAGAEFNPNVIHLFESDGSGSYEEVWDSSAETPPGAYRDITFADTDDDGLGEILGAEVSTLGKVMLFEESGGGFAFLHDNVRESDPSGAQRLRSVLIGDTNKNGRTELVVVAGGSSPTNGLVSIWEHNGVPGDNTYTRIFEYTTVSYMFQAALGDADNDTWDEIVFGLGGGGNFPMQIRRLEYDEGLGTWVHLQFESPVIGLPLTPHIADLDGDGLNELAYGSSGASGFVVAYESTGPNSFAELFSTTDFMDGNVLSLTSFSLSGVSANGAAPESFAAGSFGGDVGMWVYDGSLERILSLPGLGGAVRGLDLADDAGDGLEELLPAIAASTDQVRVYRRTDAASVPEPGAPWRGSLTVAPNPARRGVALRAEFPAPGVPSPASGNRRLAVFDLGGRLVRRLTLSDGEGAWDLRDASGREVSEGVYFIAPDGGFAPAQRVSVVR